MTPTPTPSPSGGGQRADPGPLATTTVAVTTTLVVVSAPPLGDCFAGALSEDPLHCYVVERAETEGRIDVMAVYEGDGRLYFSISQAELTAELFRFMSEESYAFYYKWPELVPEDKYAHGVVSTWTRFPTCYVDRVSWERLDARRILPLPSAYERVMLVPGGESGRSIVPGWASWRQVWPPVSAQQGAGARGTAGGSGFDVSGVDVTNFPEIDVNVCVREPGTACNLWLQFPGAGIAGAQGGADITRSGTLRRTRLGSRSSGRELARAMT